MAVALAAEEEALIMSGTRQSTICNLCGRRGTRGFIADVKGTADTESASYRCANTKACERRQRAVERETAMERRIAETLAEAPPLSEETKAKLRVLLAPPY